MGGVLSVREKYNCIGKFVILGVSFGWGIRKGIDVFIELSKRLDERYQVVLVGTDEEIDKQLPNNIVSIYRTQNQSELAAIYSMADIFVNPTREEVLGMVNVEALSCGTSVITFNTGGGPECITSECGIVVDCDDIEALEQAILDFKFWNLGDNALVQEHRMLFDEKRCSNIYLQLYNSCLANLS